MAEQCTQRERRTPVSGMAQRKRAGPIREICLGHPEVGRSKLLAAIILSKSFTMNNFLYKNNLDLVLGV